MARAKPKKSAVAGHGGKRPGAGRPRAPIPWAKVQSYAEAGAHESEILTALGITETMLQDRETSDRFRKLLDQGHALFKLQLRTEIKKRGLRSSKTAGSV